MKRGFKLLKNATLTHFRGKEAKSEEMAKVNAIRARVASAREAVACAGRADLCEEELSNLKKDYADRMDLQLGELLVQRGIKVAEVVKTWPGCDGGKESASLYTSVNFMAGRNAASRSNTTLLVSCKQNIVCGPFISKYMDSGPLPSNGVLGPLPLP